MLVVVIGSGPTGLLAGATLARISEQFARSGEFTRRYGSLTNRQFVEQIYRNVLGREGDPDGIAFWTKRLDDRRMTRGAVMLNFSESNEYVTKTGKDVQPTAVFFLMLGRLPTSADSELTSDWSASSVAGSTICHTVPFFFSFVVSPDAAWISISSILF